jgi:hypothetical protein
VCCSRGMTFLTSASPAYERGGRLAQAQSAYERALDWRGAVAAAARTGDPANTPATVAIRMAGMEEKETERERQSGCMRLYQLLSHNAHLFLSLSRAPPCMSECVNT